MADASAMQASDWVTLGLGLAAFVTAIWSNKISREALKLAGKQRIAEFRKEWIENLRIQLADFRAAAYRRRTAKTNRDFYLKSKDTELTRKWSEKYLEFTEESSRSYHYVLLCLNEEEKEHAELMARMKLHHDEKYDEIKDLAAKGAPTFLTLARTVLKKEWERLKTEFN